MSPVISIVGHRKWWKEKGEGWAVARQEKEEKDRDENC